MTGGANREAPRVPPGDAPTPPADTPAGTGRTTEASAGTRRGGKDPDRGS